MLVAILIIFATIICPYKEFLKRMYAHALVLAS